MRKIAAVALALIVAMSSMFATVAAAAGDGSVANDFEFKGFKILNPGVVVDVKNMLIYGLNTLVDSESIKEYLSPGEGFDMVIEDEYLGTGSKITLVKDGVSYPFTVVIFGDVTGDSAVDVIDAAQTQRFANNYASATDVQVMACDANDDGAITEVEYQKQVNVVLDNKNIDQHANGTDTNVSFETSDLVLTGGDIQSEIVLEEDLSILFNNDTLDDSNYVVKGYEPKTDEVTGEQTVVVEIEGKGLFGGTQYIEFKVVGLLEKIVNTVNEVIEEANLSDVVKLERVVNNGVADIAINVNATNFIRGNFGVNMAGLDGLLTKIDNFRTRFLSGADLTVDEFALATDGKFSRSALKALIFDIAEGLFCDIANADSNIVKSYSGSVVSGNTGIAEAFNIDVVMTGNGKDIDRVKAFATKIARYVAFDVVDGNAVIDITMPAAFANKVVNVLGNGDVDAAIAEFNALDVCSAAENLAKVTPEDISASSAAEIEKAISVACKLTGVVNKVLGEVNSATVADAKGNTYQLLNGSEFAIDESNSNRFGALVIGAARLLTDEVLDAKVGDFCKDGIYTVAADVSLDYKNIRETVIVNLDLFGSAESPSVIEKTAKYFDSIVADLGISNVASVSYDKAEFRGLVTLNATELLAGNLTFDESGLDGLYTDIKGYFDDNYGTSTIVVDGFEIVTSGKINKTALKNYLLGFVDGFFYDVASMTGANIVRSSAVKVTEADGKVHVFDLDFQLIGDDAAVASIKSISGKVAKYVSFETVNGNAVVNVKMPAGMTDKIVNTLGAGSKEEAKAQIDNLTVWDLLDGYVSRVTPEDISTSSADEIQTVIDMVAGMDAVINKILGKVASANIKDVNGKSMALLNGNDFVVGESSIKGLVVGFGRVLTDEVLDAKVGDFCKDGIYTVAADVSLVYGNIRETVIVNFDLFGSVESPSVIEETANYFDSIVADLGISNVASVSYDKAESRGLVTLNATELLAGNLTFDEAGLDGLYTDIKGYFDDNYGTSTIVVDGFEVVTNGKINKTALKNYLLGFVDGFFADVASMTGANIVRDSAVKVTEADGKVHEFDLDFQLIGDDAAVASIKSISGKVAKYVSFETVNGNSVVNVKMPAGMTDKIVNFLGAGSKEEAKAQIDNLTVCDLLDGYVSRVTPEDISTSSADEIQTVIDMVSGMDAVINKILGKVASANIKDVNGKSMALLNGNDFVVEESSIKGLVVGFGRVLTDKVLDTSLADFANADGTYTFECDVALTIGGISEKVVLNVEIF